jgi:hypothetical protein
LIALIGGKMSRARDPFGWERLFLVQKQKGPQSLSCASRGELPNFRTFLAQSLINQPVFWPSQVTRD